MRVRSSQVKSARWRWPLGAALALFVSAACASDDSDDGLALVQWDTLGSGVVFAQCQRLPEEPRWTVDADFHLGSADEEGDALFGEIRGIEVDGRGRLLVLDHQASEIRAFAADGHFLGVVAPSGEGPREISRANGIRVDAEGALWIHDHGKMRLTRLRPDGEVETYPFFVPGFGSLWEGGVTVDGRIWSQWTHSDRAPGTPEPGVYQRENRAYYKSFDPLSSSFDSISIGLAPFHSIVANRGEMRVPYSPTLLHALDPAGFIWTAVSNEYLLTKQTASGDTVLVVSAGCEAPLVTRAEREQAIEQAERFMERAGRVTVDWSAVLPDWKPVVEQLAVDDRGRLWVVRATADGHVLDVFDTQGRFLGTVVPAFDFVARFPPMVRDERLYLLQRDSLDVPFVVGARVPAMW
jgi:hypothetical protein